MKVYSYWEGPMPKYIEMCVKSMRDYCPEFILITPENVDEYLNGTGLSVWWKSVRNPAHRADCIRVAIINKHGGLWVDCDTIFINPISEFEEYVDFIKSDFIYTRWSDGRCPNGYFWGKQGNPVTGEWIEKINMILDKKTGGGGQWTSFGEKILTPIINSNKYYNVAHKMDRRIFLPINFDRIPWVFFEPLHWSAFVTNQTVAVGLNHSWFNHHKKQFVQSQTPWDGEELIHSIIREAI